MQKWLRHYMRERAYRRGGLAWRMRVRRMRQCLQLMNLPRGARIIDLGGTPMHWELVGGDFDITLVNLPEEMTERNVRLLNEQGYHVIGADATDLSGIVEDNAYDVVFSNSTIEHVGGRSRQEAFAREVHRIAPAHWIQTPSDRFPIEAHTGVPFYWRLPETARRRMHARWSRKMPGWYRMIADTRVLSQQRMAELFPDSQVFIERRLGLEKSYCFYQPVRAACLQVER